MRGLFELLLVGAVAGGFVALWFALGTWGGVLFTRRALIAAAALAPLGVAGFWVPSALDAMLLADAALVALVWLDVALAVAPPPVLREPLPALSVGHAGEVAYRWSNGARRRARLRVREIRPDLLGGAQPPRMVAVPAEGGTRETLSAIPVRRGRETSGGFVVDSIGPLGLGRRRAAGRR